jgi:hypothetical protein
MGRRRVGPTYGFTASPEMDLGATVGTLQIGYSYIQASSQDRERGVHPCVVTCPAVPDPVSQLRWAPELPRVQWLRTPPPC